MRSLFGTDGARGEANVQFTPELVLKLGQALQLILDKGQRVVVGRDTRRSGTMLEAALVAGMTSVGLDAVRVGVVPTPAIPILCNDLDCQLGVSISASHNVASDNGIKFFTKEGFKISPELENKIERFVNSPADLRRVSGKDIGTVVSLQQALDRYEKALMERVAPQPSPLKRLKLVVDCAHGATYKIAPRLLSGPGTEVIALHTRPTGDNINSNCGSTSMNKICKRLKKEGADLGVAFDGDGDRALFVDERGEIVDGDEILFLCARWLKRQGKLDPPLVVSTVMSNLGLERALKKENINLLRTPVGDRYVAEKMKSEGALLGGEQSGHIIHSNYNTTGDGLITALQVLRILFDLDKPLSRLTAPFERVPQLLKNVKVDDPGNFKLESAIEEEVKKWNKILNNKGRLLIRPSGTQPFIRIMVESSDEQLAHKAANQLSSAVEREMNS